MQYKTPLNLLTNEPHIVLIGLGGSGSHFFDEIISLDSTLKMLGAKGFKLTAIDGSDVTQANLARQKFFTTQVGENKAAASVFKSNNLYGKTWTSIEKNITANELIQLRPDIIVTAVDSAKFRYEVSMLEDIHCLWLDMGNDTNSGQVCLGELCNVKQKLLPCITDLYDYSIIEDTSSLKSCSAEESVSTQEWGVNATAARYSAQLLWKLFRHGSTQEHGAYFDCDNLTAHPMKNDLKDWQIHGFVPANAVE